MSPVIVPCVSQTFSDRPIAMQVALSSHLNCTPPPEDIPRTLTPDLEGPDVSTIYPRSSSQEPGEL